MRALYEPFTVEEINQKINDIIAEHNWLCQNSCDNFCKNNTSPTTPPPPKGDGDEIPTVPTQPAESFDPNDKTVTEGYGAKKYVAANESLNYKVEFENEAEATGPARWIRVYDTLAEEFDLDTFELKSICLAGNYIEVGDGRDSFNQLIDVKLQDGSTVQVQVAINLDADTREIYADFMAIDPETGWMEQDVTKGILFPEDESGRGQGFFTYEVALKDGIENGIEITNTAEIYFDFNDPIDTPTTLNTVDADAPAKPTMELAADGTSVTITLHAADADSGIAGFYIKYSLDGEAFYEYCISTMDSISFVGEAGATYYFVAQAFDNVGNASEWSDVQMTTLFIDNVAPEITGIAADVTTPTNCNVVVTATASDAESAVMLYYSKDNGDWQEYIDGVVFMENGSVVFKAVDAAGNETISDAFQVTNIDKVAPLLSNLDISEPDANGMVAIAVTANEPLSQLKYSWNGNEWTEFPGEKLFVSKSGFVQFQLLDAAGNETITGKFEVSIPIQPGDDDWTDLATMGSGSSEIGNFGVAEIGTSVTGEIGMDDKIDYMAIELDSAVSLSFTVSSVNAAKFTLYQLQSKASKGITTYSLKSLQVTTLKANVAATTKNLLLNKGTYYLCMAATDKKALDAAYSVTVNDKSVFFTEGDNSDDWTDMKTTGAEGLAATLGTVTAESGTLVEDGWVGFGDAIDYAAFTLDSGASLAFDLNATDAAKFTIYQLQSKVSKNVTTYSLKSLQSTALKKNVAATTKNLLLEKGIYYVAMEGSNAKKGGSASYTVALGEKSRFYPVGDNSDDWGDMKTEGAAGAVGDLGVVAAESGMLREDGWVGFGDAIDYASFTLGSAASLAFDLTSTDAAKFTVYQLQSKENKTGTTYSLKSLQSTTLKANVNATTKNLLLEKGTYYVAMESPNAKKGGYADYSIASSEKSTFFTDGNNDDDVWNAAELPVFGGEWEDWTGYGDAIDYRKLEMATPGRLALDLTATDATKFTVWQLDAKTNKLKSVQATTLKANKDKTQYTASTKELLLNGGTYYISMECTTAKKGGSADFTVAYGDRYELFENCDNTNDIWKDARLQEAVALEEALNGWVGFGDTADFYRFEVAEAGKLSLTFDEDTEAAVKAKQLKLSCLDANGKAVSLVAFEDGSVASSKALAEGEYYLGITCANVQKYDTSYSVTLGMLA
ncbi:MAG: hypothetical protein IJT83_09185 [Victivallales bacterium]|nr:hypothetical protein [Victivallales bacterium]